LCRGAAMPCLSPFGTALGMFDPLMAGEKITTGEATTTMTDKRFLFGMLHVILLSNAEDALSETILQFSHASVSVRVV
jgi:hypothetical protein